MKVNHRYARLPRRAAGLAGIVLLLWSAGLYAQERATEAPTQDQTPAPLAIPLSQIPVRAQEVSDLIDEIQPLVAPDRIIDTIKVALPVFADSVASGRTRPGFQNLERLSARALTDLNSRWQGYRAKVKTWEEQLLNKAGDLSQGLEQLNSFAALWRAARDSASASRAPRVLRRQIDRTLASIDQKREELEVRFREVLSLQEAVAAQSLPLNEDIKRIEDRQEELDRQIFVVDAPPLWRGLSESKDTTGVVATVSESWSRTINETVRYLNLNTDRAILHLLFSLFFFALFLLLRRQVTKLATQEPLPGVLPDAVRLLRRPAAATLLVLVYLVRHLYPDAPVGLIDVARIVVVIPFLILALFWLKSGMRGAVIALALLYILELTRQLIAEDPGPARLLLLVQGVVGAGAIGYLLRPGGALRTAGTVPRERLVRWLTTLALILLVGAIASNIAGSVSLAGRITSGVTMAAASALFYAILVLLADGALFFAVKAWVTRFSRFMHRFGDVVVHAGMKLFAFVGLVVWLLGALSAFGFRAIVVGWVEGMLAMEWGIGSVQITLGHILLFGVVLITSFALARIIRLGLEEEVFSRVRLPRGVPGAIAMVVRYTIVGLGIVLALAALGLDLGKFGLLAGALGVGLGFGLQNIVANFVSGIILAFERPIQAGDMVQFGSLWGTITSIGVRSTKVRSFDGSEVVIPNSDLISKEVTNWTLSDRLRRLDFPVKVEFGSDPRQVIDVMLTAVRNHEIPLTQPEPFVIFQGLGEYYLAFTLYFWITTDRYLAGKNEVGCAVLDALKTAGIQIPSAPRRITIDDRQPSGGEPRGAL